VQIYTTIADRNSLCPVLMVLICVLPQRSRYQANAWKTGGDVHDNSLL
jgi:hypothetical protein